jgi:hypothetical protein
VLHLDPILPPLLLIPLFVVLFYLDWRHLRERSRLAQTSRILLWVILAILVARPSQVAISEVVDRARLYFVEDVSDSMAVRDVDDNTSRADAVALARRNNQTVIAGLSQHFDVHERHLGRTTASPGSGLATDATALGDALSMLADQAAGTRVAGIVLLTDGRQNTGTPPEIAAARLAALDVPIHAVQVGRDQLADDVVDAVILDLQAPLTTEVASNAAITITGTTRNLTGRKVTVLAAVNDAELQPVDAFTPATGESNYRHTFTMPMPEEAGFHTLTVALQSEGQEITPLNNRMSTPFRTRDDAIRILLLEGTLRAEFKFLRRLLEDNDAFSPTIAPPFLLASPAGKSFLEELKLNRYDVIILGDLSSDLLPTPVGEGILSLVRNRGAGLFVLGGPRNLEPEQWRSHPLSPALPFVFSAGAKKPRTQSFSPKPPAPPPNHFLTLAITEPAYARVWELPPLRGLRNVAIAPTPLGTTLLVDQSNRPLVVSGDFGTGRVLATLHDASWNWQTEDDPAPAFHREFFTRGIYYLASREDAMNSRLSISAGRSRIRLGSPLQIRGDLLGTDGGPVDDAAVQLRLRHLDDGDELSLPMTADQGRYLASISPVKPGPYTIQATAPASDLPLVSNELRIIVYDDRIEDRNVLAAPEVLSKLATDTGGTYRQLNELPELLAFLPSRARTVTIRKTESSRNLWDTLPLFLLLLAAATIHWLPPRKNTRAET